MSQDHIDELYRRTEQNSKDTLVAITRIDLHEKNCMEKHEAVLKQQKATHQKLDGFIDSHNRWMKGLLTAIILACLAVIMKGHI